MTTMVEVFTSPGCRVCGRAKTLLREIAEQVGCDRIHWRAINVLEELDYAVDLGVLSTPAIAIDGELIFTGLPPMHALRAELDRRLAIET
ncbi:MAG: glutaredoxin [Porticoccaceae bacterium]|nr:glutaredoxin [Porticoccaceae bacterium]